MAVRATLCKGLDKGAMAGRGALRRLHNAVLAHPVTPLPQLKRWRQKNALEANERAEGKRADLWMKKEGELQAEREREA